MIGHDTKRTEDGWKLRFKQEWCGVKAANMRNLVAQHDEVLKYELISYAGLSCSDQTIILQSQNPQPARLMWINMLEVIGCGCHMLPLPNLGVFRERLQTQFQGNIFFTIDDWNRAFRAQRFSVIFPAPDTFKPPWVGAGRDRGKVKTKTAWNLGSLFFGNPLHDYKTYRNLRTIH